MDNVFEIGLLLDFYGQLLTDRQQEILDLHYNNDYSLGEIAEQLCITRQGVFDNIKRGKTILNNLELKLGLVKKFSEQKERALEILKYLKDINVNELTPSNLDNLKRVEEGVNDIINKI
jgi:uncharacterized protein